MLLPPRFRSSRHFLHTAARHTHEEWDESSQAVSDDTDHPVEAIFGTRLPEDSDTGPAEAFAWVSELLRRTDVVCSLTHRSCRERGYVMWDYERLSAWGYFTDLWGSSAQEVEGN